MRLTRCHRQLPAAETAASNGSLARILLETECGVTALRNVDQWLPRDFVERACIFLVSHQRDDDPRSFQSANALQRLERIKNHGVPAFHVRAACARGKGIETHKPLTLALE